MGVMETIFSQGDDAIGYEFQISLGPIPYLDVATNLLVRCNTVEIPAISVQTYEYDYKSEKVVKPNGKIGTPKEFSTEFRIDKYYNLYKAIKTWNNAIVSPVSGGVATDSNNGVSAIRIPITVSTGTYDIEGNFVPTLQVWNFTGCFPVEVGGFTLDSQSGDPVMCTVRWSFLKMF